MWVTLDFENPLFIFFVGQFLMVLYKLVILRSQNLLVRVLPLIWLTSEEKKHTHTALHGNGSIYIYINTYFWLVFMVIAGVKVGKCNIRGCYGKKTYKQDNEHPKAVINCSLSKLAFILWLWVTNYLQVLG